MDEDMWQLGYDDCMEDLEPKYPSHHIYMSGYWDAENDLEQIEEERNCA